MKLQYSKTFFKFIFVYALLIGHFSFSQVVIARQDFESTPSAPVMAFTTSDIGSPGSSTNFSTGNSGSNASPQNANLFSEGSRGYRIQGPNSGSATAGRIFTFSNVNTINYTNISASFRVAGMSIGSTGNGIDNTTDQVLIEISPDGGTNWYQQAEVVSEAGNLRWYFGATGSGSRNYLANNSLSTFTTTSNVLSGSSSLAITTVTINNLPTVSNLRIRISAQVNSVNESWIIDDVRIVGTAVPLSPLVTTNATTSIGVDSAILSGTINANDLTVDATFEYGTTTSYGSSVSASPSTVTGSTVTSISASISSLDLNTQYHYRAVGTVSGTPTNGSEMTFYTLAATPGVLTLSNPLQTTLDVTLNATTENSNPAITEYAIQETGGQYVQANGTLGASEVWQTAATWATTTITGLSTSALYTFQAKARNGANVETVFGTSASETTLAAQLVDYAVVQFPNTTQSILEGANLTVYARAYEPGLTTLSGEQSNLFAWIGYSSTDVDPSNPVFTWIPATFNAEFGNDDEYQATLTGLPIGTYYYAVRFQIGTGPYVYGGSNGNWNNDNVTLNVNADVVDFANVQFPTTATITEGNAVTVYAQVYEPGVTEAAGQGAGITAEIGYSSTDSTPDATWTWTSATFNVQSNNNDEYQATIGSNLAPGTYYYASRFLKSGSSTYVYGGTTGIWSSGNSGVLTVNALGNPNATAASDITPSSFTANWDAVTDANSYELDVYELSNTVSTNLLISEYGEGSSGSKKYIEIFNGTGTTIDLVNYEIWLISNGGSWPESTISLSGTLGNNSTYVIANNSSDVIGADLYTGLLSFNGDDAVGLAWNGGSGVVYNLIDSVGEDGSGPGSGWSVAGISNATVDKILIRKPSVFSPTTDWSVSSGLNSTDSQWIVSSFTYSGTGDTTNLGSHTFSGGISANYVINNLNIGNVTSYNVSGLTQGTTYYYRVRAVGQTTSDNSNVIDVTTGYSSVTWDGTSWTNTVGPDSTMDAIIEGVYSTLTNGAFNAKTVTLNLGSFTVNEGTTVTVENAVVNNLLVQIL
ncbi:beta strand repeat-containing protein [Flavobacterium sp.]|uniref:beta strand repeat-containing protein n=1 Tax=Flavobacterium sp. TaxID=239 RepID=UPI003F69D185